MKHVADINTVIAGPVLVTSVGCSAKEVYANVRAHVVRAGSLPLLGRRYDEYVLATVPEESLPPPAVSLSLRPGRTSREVRLLRLLALAGSSLPPLATRKPPALFLSLPEHTTQIPVDGGEVLNDLQHQCPGWFDRAQSKADWRGRAGGLLAIGAAVSAVSKGEADVILAGGVDSFLDAWVLSSLDKNGRVKAGTAPDSFVPGEGCGLVYVVRKDKSEALGLSPLAAVSSVCEGFEPGHWASKEPYLGAGLAETVGKLLEQHPPASPITEVYSSMNGESYWGKEWGVARLRCGGGFAPEVELHHPSEFFGDLGAAAGPVMTGLAAMGLQKQGGGPFLVYGSSDFGCRAALLLSTLNN